MVAYGQRRVPPKPVERMMRDLGLKELPDRTAAKLTVSLSPELAQAHLAVLHRPALCIQSSACRADRPRLPEISGSRCSEGSIGRAKTPLPRKGLFLSQDRAEPRLESPRSAKRVGADFSCPQVTGVPSWRVGEILPTCAS